MENYWISWYDCRPGEWEWHGPWWITGIRDSDDANIICVAVQAYDCGAAKNTIYKIHHSKQKFIEFRLYELKPKEWNPLQDLNSRFPAQSWMRWPMDFEKNRSLHYTQKGKAAA